MKLHTGKNLFLLVSAFVLGEVIELKGNWDNLSRKSNIYLTLYTNKFVELKKI